MSLSQGSQGGSFGVLPVYFLARAYTESRIQGMGAGNKNGLKVESH
jgi:hypothetical protein